MARGGKRPGAGRPKGSKDRTTRTKEEAREAARALITKHLRPLIQRQIAHAMGIGHLYTRDKTGKFTKIEDQRRVDELLTGGKEGEDYWIFTKDPSVQAFTDLMNRALDKPKEQEQEIRVSGELEIVTERLLAARKRLAARARGV